MTRTLALPAARHFHVGALRASAPGATLHCLVLVEGPDWVAADVATGALLRPFASQAAAHAAVTQAVPAQDLPAPASEAAAPLGTSPVGCVLSTVSLLIGEDDEPFDPARPEAVRIAENGVARLAPARRRVVRHLLGKLVTRAPQSPLLGSLGPSVAYSDLEGDHPSVTVIEPDQRPRFGNGPTGPWCQFSLGGRKHALPLQSRPEHVLGIGAGAQRQGGRVRKHRPGAQAPRLLVVGYGVPRHGQVPKVVLGAISEQPLR